MGKKIRKLYLSLSIHCIRCVNLNEDAMTVVYQLWTSSMSICTRHWPSNYCLVLSCSSGLLLAAKTEKRRLTEAVCDLLRYRSSTDVAPPQSRVGVCTHSLEELTDSRTPYHTEGSRDSGDVVVSAGGGLRGAISPYCLYYLKTRVFLSYNFNVVISDYPPTPSLGFRLRNGLLVFVGKTLLHLTLEELYENTHS